MIATARSYVVFWARMIALLLKGGRAYWLWLGLLSVFVGLGVIAYFFQFRDGLIVTNMVDQVSWGAYIANFTFLVGVAAAAVLLVVPAYVYHHKAIKEIVLLGELLAVSAIAMCLMFVVVDLGHPDRFLHLIPVIGRMNFPASVLAWDVLVLNVYLLLNLHIPGYLLFQKYRQREPRPAYYLPFVFVSIAWAVSIHTVTAFLYSGLGSRPFWNAAILAPRFLVSAFAGGPAIIILVFGAVNHFSSIRVKDEVFRLLEKIMLFAMVTNLFLLACEAFKEFYTGSLHVASARYLFVGLHGHARLVPFIWTAIALEIAALVVVAVPKLRARTNVLRAACVMAVVGIWTEKGMGLIIPGFVPTPLGEVVEYTPSVTEFFVSAGIWAAGALIFTLTAKIAIAIQTGRLTERGGFAPATSASLETAATLRAAAEPR